MKRIKMHEICKPNTNVAEGILVAKKVGRAGGIPGCVHLACTDIGRAWCGRKSYWTSWGRNISAAEIPNLLKIGLTPIWVGADDGSVEVVLPDRIAEKLLTIMIG